MRHCVVRQSTNGGAFDGDWPTSAVQFMDELGSHGWRLVSTAVLHNGMLMMFWENPLPDPFEPPIPEEVHGNYA